MNPRRSSPPLLLAALALAGAYMPGALMGAGPIPARRREQEKEEENEIIEAMIAQEQGKLPSLVVDLPSGKNQFSMLDQAMENDMQSLLFSKPDPRDIKSYRRTFRTSTKSDKERAKARIQRAQRRKGRKSGKR